MSKPHNDDSDAGVEWGTPPEIVEPLSKTIGGFDLDPASGAELKPCAKEKYTKEDNGLFQEWFGHVWLNPPYGREHNLDWAQKTYHESKRDNVQSITALVPNSTSTDWWQKYYVEADLFVLLSSRVEFIGAGDDGASFASVICVFGSENLPDEYFNCLSQVNGGLPNTVLGRTKTDNRSLFDF